MRLAKHKNLSKPMPACGYHFRFPSYMPPNVHYDKAELPINLKVTPDRLRRLCAVALDAQPLANAYKWTIDETVDWLSQLGLQEYEVSTLWYHNSVHYKKLSTPKTPYVKKTFRANFICGRRLPLLNTKTLTDMNIKDFRHIKRILHGIRILFKQDFLDSTQLRQTDYQLCRSRTGNIYENLLRKSDFLVEKSKAIEDLNDWDLICLNAAEPKILFGRVRRKQDTLKKPKIATRRENVTKSLLLNALYESLSEFHL